MTQVNKLIEKGAAMKSLLLTIIFILFIIPSIIYSQNDLGDEQVQQFSTGNFNITFNVVDFETGEQLIGASIFSFDLKKEIGKTDFYGIVKTAKGLDGNIEVSYIGYRTIRFKLNDNKVDSILVGLKSVPLNYGFEVEDRRPEQLEKKIDSHNLTAKSETKSDIKNNDDQIIQLSTGKDKLIFNVVDSDDGEPLISAKIYSFNKKDNIAYTDINGNAEIEKGIPGSFEVSFIGYKSACFKIQDETIDSISVKLKIEVHLTDDYMVYNAEYDSACKSAKELAKYETKKGNVYLYYKNEPSDEQQDFAKGHSFYFKPWKGKFDEAMEIFNTEVINYLSEKFKADIWQELRAICWRNE